MKTRILIIVCLLISIGTFGQTNKSQYLGMNVLQLPASTINVNYSLEIIPFFTPVADIGYTFNYVKTENVDLPGRYLTSHYKEEFGKTMPWIIYRTDKQSGGYAKLGGYFNFRKDFEQQNFFHLGLFMTNSIVYESALMQELYPVTYLPTAVSHTVFIFGLSCAGGYEFSITKRFKSDVDFQISVPGKNYEELYGYSNFIPGMGYKDNESQWFPMLIWNLKYKL